MVYFTETMIWCVGISHESQNLNYLSWQWSCFHAVQQYTSLSYGFCCFVGSRTPTQNGWIWPWPRNDGKVFFRWALLSSLTNSTDLFTSETDECFSLTASRNNVPEKANLASFREHSSFSNADHDTVEKLVHGHISVFESNNWVHP